MDFLEVLTDWPLGTLLGVLMVIVVILIILTVAWGLFMAVDSWFLPRKKSRCVVVDKSHSPFHFQTIIIDGATHLQPIPESWSVELRIEKEGNRTDSISVSQPFFNCLRKGSPVEAEYVVGRLSGEPYLKSIL